MKRYAWMASLALIAVIGMSLAACTAAPLRNSRGLPAQKRPP